MPSPTDVERAWDQVRRNPRDLALRRHLADILVKQGDPLGEFLSIVLTPDKERPSRSGSRADKLFQRHGDAWFPLPPGEKPAIKSSWTMFVGRGVPDSLGFSTSGLPPAELVAWWAARYPIRHVYIRLPDPTEALAALEQQGLLALAESLELSDCTLSDAAVDAIANATAGLRSLQLTKPRGLDAARAERLFHGRGLADTTFLGIAAATLEPPVIRALWSGLPKLEGLRLYNIEFGKQSLALPRNLRRRWTDVSIEGSLTVSQTLELVGGLDLSVTRSLHLRRGSSSVELMAHLRDAVHAGELQALHALELQYMGIRATHLAVLLEAPPPNLVRLDISNNSIGEEGLKKLAAYERQSRTLKSLPLDGLSIGSGVWEVGTDWDGSGSFSYERLLTAEEIREKFHFGATLDAGEWLHAAEEHARRAPEDLSALPNDQVKEAIKVLDAVVSALDEVLKLLPRGATHVPETAFWSDLGRDMHQRAPELFERKRLEEKRSDWKQRSHLASQLLSRREAAVFHARNTELAQMLLEGLRKPEDPEHRREREEHERKNAELLEVYYVTSKKRPPRARSLAEMELATELEACPSCKQRGLTGVRVHGSGTDWTADATCPGCGTSSTFRYTTKSDPATVTAPPYELAPGPSQQIRKEAFRQELERVLPHVDSDPAMLQRALICVHELCKLFYNRPEVQALEAQRASLLAKASAR